MKHHKLPVKKPRKGRLGHREEGVALLMVLVTIAVLSVIIVDFAFQTRVNLHMAANVRDRTKAYYLGRSAFNLSRLVLHFQGQIDRATGGMVKLYQLIPLESDLAKAFTSGEMGKFFGMEGLSLGKEQRGFGDFDGSFVATIEDEYSKLNVNALDGLPSIVGPLAAQLLTLIGNPRYQTMFEEKDADGQYSTPADVVMAMHDWIDSDNTRDNFQPEALLANPTAQANVFLPGTSSEDSRYDMLRDPYKNKNDPFWTVDELFLIRGIGDDFMHEFGDKLTVYTDPNFILNLTSVNDPVLMLSILCMQPQNVSLCTEQGLPRMLEILGSFFEFRNLMQMSTMMTPNNDAIKGFFDGMGAGLDTFFMKALAPFSDTFSIVASGTVNEVSVTIRAVVKNTVSGQEILYWKIL